jgi:hypothetical protein
MQTQFGPKQIIIAFLVVLVCYLGIFQWIEHRRLVKGPWELGFDTDTDGTPVLTVRQSALKIEGAQLKVPGEKAPDALSSPVAIAFDQPGVTPPFGQIIYEDLTFLPGVITFNLFGHEIEILPRVLIINKQQVKWTPGLVVEMNPESKPENPPTAPEGGTRDLKKGFL